MSYRPHASFYRGTVRSREHSSTPVRHYRSQRQTPYIARTTPFRTYRPLRSTYTGTTTRSTTRSTRLPRQSHQRIVLDPPQSESSSSELSDPEEIPIQTSLKPSPVSSGEEARKQVQPPLVVSKGGLQVQLRWCDDYTLDEEDGQCALDLLEQLIDEFLEPGPASQVSGDVGASTDQSSSTMTKSVTAPP